jgi:hypothetical protein
VREYIDILAEAQSQIPPELAAQILSDRLCKHGVKLAPSARLWRGEGSEGGSGFATYGRGLYFTADRKVAAEYAGDDGEIVEIARAYLPDNALRFDTTNDFQIWKQRAYTLLGFRGPQEFAAAYDDLGVFIRTLDPTIDGIQMFTGKDSVFVLYGMDE